MRIIDQAKRLLGFSASTPTAVGAGGYDAARDSSRRRTIATNLESEDNILKGAGRKKVISTTRELRRNFSVARWMINKHLDFTTRMSFKSRSGDRNFDIVLETLVDELMAKESFDVTSRFPHRKFVRLMQASRTVDGDILPVRVKWEGGAKLQLIESDRVRDPGDGTSEKKSGRWVQGVRLGTYGAPTGYAVHRRTGKTNFEFERIVRSERAELFGYFDRYDQYRGVSPLAGAINTLVGVYDSFDYALAKSKLSQLFALSIFRSSDSAFSGNIDDDDEPEDGEDENESSQEKTAQHKIDFNNGPVVLDLDDGARAEILESNQPGVATADFWQELISTTLKALSLPYSFYDESFTNFFGQKNALMLYLKSVKEDQADIQDFNDWWLVWRLSIAIEEGVLVPPIGYDVNKKLWKWAPDGIPWWNPPQEVRANLDAVEGGLISRTQIRMETWGDDWRDVIDQLSDEAEYAESKGVTLSSKKERDANKIPETDNIKKRVPKKNREEDDDE